MFIDVKLENGNKAFGRVFVVYRFCIDFWPLYRCEMRCLNTQMQNASFWQADASWRQSTAGQSSCSKQRKVLYLRHLHKTIFLIRTEVSHDQWHRVTRRCCYLSKGRLFVLSSVQKSRMEPSVDQYAELGRSAILSSQFQRSVETITLSSRFLSHSSVSMYLLIIKTFTLRIRLRWRKESSKSRVLRLTTPNHFTPSETEARD